ncbi:hypothetical protein OH687_24095 [Burkholderia anthina]|nr:hypothetical protein OH687_24095 [Burkholderia anthina]
MRPPCTVRLSTSSTAGPGIRNRPRTTAVKVVSVVRSNMAAPAGWRGGKGIGALYSVRRAAADAPERHGCAGAFLV